MTWIAVGVAVAGTATGLYAKNQQARTQDKIAAQNIYQQGEQRAKANQVVDKNIQAAQKNPAALAQAQQTENAQYASALQRAKPTGQDAAFTAPAGASSRYAADVGTALKNNAAFGANQATNMSITDAPGIVNTNTQLGLGDSANKLGLISDQAQRINALNTAKINATQANPWLSTLGALMQSGGAAYAGSEFAGGGGTIAKKGPVDISGTQVALT